MGDAPIRSVVNIACAPPFACRAVAASRMEADELADQLASGLALRVLREEAELTVGVVEPLELATVAREVTRIGGSLRAFAAMPDALELLLDADESWRWICAALDFELREDQRPFVATIGGGYLELDELADGYTFLERPVIAITELPRRAPNRREAPQVFDQDRCSVHGFDLERDAHGWFVHDSNDRSIQLNGQRIRALHRVTIGDHITYYYGSSGVEVLAIL